MRDWQVAHPIALSSDITGIHSRTPQSPLFRGACGTEQPRLRLLLVLLLLLHLQSTERCHIVRAVSVALSLQPRTRSLLQPLSLLPPGPPAVGSPPAA
jgi:hypothetical protein